jgi:hypothetical protein
MSYETSPSDQEQPLIPDPSRSDLAVSHEDTVSKELAANLVAVAQEHGSEGVRDYLVDVLADKEGTVPTQERRGAFKLLAGEQRKSLQEDITNIGEDFVATRLSQNNNTEEEIGDNDRINKRTFEELIDEHRLSVGRHLRDGGNTRLASRAHEDLEHDVRKGIRVINEFGEIMNTWSRVSRSKVEDFAGDIDHSLNHDRALSEAEKVTDPNYGGEPRDISLVIDEAVKQKTAIKLNEAVQQAQEKGDDTQEAVIKVLLEDRPDDISTDELKSLRAFAGHYERFAAVESPRIERETEEVGQVLKTFMNRGNEDYAYSRTIEEAQDVYRRQSQALERAVSEAGSIAPHARNILATERNDLLILKQQLAQFKSKKLEAEAS